MDKVFPKAGSYLVQVDGLLPEGPVANKTTLTVQGGPAMTPRALQARVGVADLLVKSTPLELKSQPAVSLSSLVLQSPGNSNVSLPAAAAGTATTSMVSETGHTYKATLSGPSGQQCIPGQPLSFSWSIADGSSGAPITDLEPYYAAPMHLAVVKSDMSFMAHEHGNAPDNRINASQSSNASDASNTGTDMNPVTAAGQNSTANMQQAAAHAGHTRRVFGRAARSLKQGESSGGMSSTSNMQDLGSLQNEEHAHAADTARYGPEISADLDGVVLPTPGVYLFVGQVARGDELILLPKV